ncbi:outer membrane beta-barrel protein [Proteiniphilum sp. X52]|uniref:outer membrane beta-barrel protein n=1 Tax=Proteiniphilum sp. X52 TaxID=2382159 RepID=UPI000F09D6BF|nr:outer membrane beta-barrel protein [Proteiniphilum sp. X52]RNC66182.1 PorT family protein [Proteiniphilum sp. X52]
MQSDDKYTDKPDDFSRRVGVKLREHQMPVDSGVWDSLTERLPTPKRAVFTYWPWAAAGIAGVAVVLLFLINPLADESLLTEHSQPKKQIQQEKAVPEIISDETEGRTDKELDLKQIVDDNSREPDKNRELVGIAKPQKTSESQKTSEPEKKLRPAETMGLAEASAPREREKSTEITKPEEIMIPERTTKPDVIGVLAATVKLEEFPATERTPYPGEMVKTDTVGFGEQPGLRSLIAALGSGGAPLDFSLGSYDAAYPQHDYHFPGGKFNGGNGLGSGGDYNLLNPGDYTEVVHHLPVSVSLTADFAVAKDMSLETGLSYTYLFSRYRRNDDFIYRGALRQHYIGIPVNLRYTLWQNDAWKVYLLGGGSIEKGLRSVYKQEIERNGGVVYHTNLYSHIKGFQFSAQGGVGFSYRLQGNLSLFGEPRIVYYFNNNQPMSARTENPLIFGLNMGIRLQVK